MNSLVIMRQIFTETEKKNIDKEKLKELQESLLFWLEIENLKIGSAK